MTPVHDPLHRRSEAGERFPLVIDRRRIRLLPTRYGLLFCIVLATMLAGAANHNNNFAFLLTFLLAGIGMVSLFYGHRNLSGLEVQAVAGTPAFAGDNAVFTLSVRNPVGSRRALEAAVGDGETRRFSLAGGNAASIDLFFQTRRRGVVSASPLTLSTVYPMGLFRARAILRPDVSVPVYPTPVAAPIRPSAGTGEGGTGAVGSMAGSEDFDGIRPYRPGDPLRRIAWKAVSKERGLAVKHFTGATGGAVFLDWTGIADKDVEKKLSILCSWILTADRQGIPYGVRLPNRTFPPDTGPTHRAACLTALAVFGNGGLDP
jgi:uncharacterized protein (DUF58 family)